jgi:surface antigen
MMKATQSVAWWRAKLPWVVGCRQQRRLRADMKPVMVRVVVRLGADSQIMRWRFSVVAVGLLLALPVAAQAQTNPFRSSRIGTGLTNEDRVAMGAAGRRLYDQPTVADGASDQWSNPKSGNSGTITVLQSVEKSGMTCRNMRYVIHLAKRTGSRTYTVNWCKTASGEWKLG